MPTYNGTNNNDVLQGGAGADFIYGFGGNDILLGWGGADYIDGGSGNDTIIGNDGQNPDSAYDQLIGGDGDDTVYADFDDYASGGNGTDTLIYRMDNCGFGVSIDWTYLWLGYTYTIGSHNVGGFEHLWWVTGTQYNDELTLGTPAGKTSEVAGLGGHDILIGGAGNDLINADFFYSPSTPINDTYSDAMAGLGGDDWLSGGLGDYFDGGSGTDKITLYCDMSNSGVTIDLNTLIASGTDVIGTTEFYGIEHVYSVYGSNYDDDINAGSENANMTLWGRAGDDVLQAGTANDTINGGTGADSMLGGAGNDSYTVDDAGDSITENGAGYGTDTVNSSISLTLGSNLENLTLTGASNLDGTGNSLANTIYGTVGNNSLSGLGGDDVFNASNGNDVVTGGAGFDIMTGGAGADEFVFADGDMAGLATTTADRVTDFSHAAADILRLSGIDAVAGGADDAFSFIGTGAFTGVAGQLRYAWSGGYTLIQGDTNGDGLADLAISLTGSISLVGADFVL